MAVTLFGAQDRQPRPEKTYRLTVTAKTRFSLKHEVWQDEFQKRLLAATQFTLVGTEPEPNDNAGFERWTFDVQDTWKVAPRECQQLYGNPIVIRGYEMEIEGYIWKDRALQFIHTASGMEFKVGNQLLDPNGPLPPDFVTSIEKWMKEGRRWFRVRGKYDPLQHLLLLSESSQVSVPKLPETPAASVEKDMRRRVAASVVKLEGAQGSGAGVCVAAGGWVVAPAHLLTGTRGVAKVTVHAWDGDRIKKLPTLKGEIWFASDVEDVAVLRVAGAPASLLPLPISATEAKAGDKVVVFWSRTMMADPPDQGFADAEFLAIDRKLQERTFLEQSFIPIVGKFGGPVVNAEGQILGLTTSQPKAERGALAIRAKAIVDVFTAGAK